MAEKKFKRYDPSILYGPQIVGEKVRELLKGKYEMIPKTTANVRVNPKKCIGFFPKRVVKVMVSRSRYPLKKRSRPYLVTPYFLF